MNKLKLAALISLFLSALAFSSNALAFNPLGEACKDQAASSPTCVDSGGTKDPIAGPDGIINKTANLIALFTAVAAVIMILIGGFFYITSAGNPEQATAARHRIINAVVGLVIIALAWAIVRFISDRVLQ